jgi:hypothetical protein
MCTPILKDLCRRISPLTSRVQSRHASTPHDSASDAFARHPDVASCGTTPSRENETTGGEPLGEFHRLGADWNGNRCVDDDGRPTTRPPCAAYVEIMVPVFTRRAWRCVWEMIQNDLSHGWGLDLTWQLCAADEKRNATAVDGMGVVDAQGITHLGAPTLTEQGVDGAHVAGTTAVRRRRTAEWSAYNRRWRTPDLRETYLAEEKEEDEDGKGKGEGEGGDDADATNETDARP